MIVADTNVWSEPLRTEPSGNVVNWIQSNGDDLAITAITIGELFYGVNRLPAGRRRLKLEAGVERAIKFAGPRVLVYDQPAARAYADLLAARMKVGRPISAEDGMIAGICLATGAAVATRNVRHFKGIGIKVINPWEPDDPQP